MTGRDRGWRLTTAQLNRRRWPDCERFFSTVESGWCACMLAPRGRHLPATEEFRTREAILAQNLRDLKDLVWQDKAHGILVFGDGEAVGWCQYGRVTELPLSPAPRAARLPDSRWRITCLLTRLNRRRRGVGSAALAAAVKAIERAGGGQIEATPVVAVHRDPELSRLRRSYGWRSDQVREHLRSWPTVDVPGIGPVEAAHGGPRGGSHHGILSMFTRLGFEPVMRAADPDDERWWNPTVRSRLIVRRVG